MKKRKILVTGAGGAAATNFIKSLKLTNDYLIYGVDSNQYHLKLSVADINCLGPSSPPYLFIDKLNQLTKKYGIDFIHPQPDVHVKIISDNREALIAKTFLPDQRTINICQNKWSTYENFKEKGVSCATSFLLENNSDLEKASKHLLRTKKTFWIRADAGAGGKASLPVDNITLAKEWIKYWERKDENIKFIASEFLIGREYAFQSIWHEGRLIVSQGRERLEYLLGYLSPSGQTSSPAVARTINNKLVNKVARDAVLAVDKNATGVFCVDLKTSGTGKICVTEINAGRFFTTSNFIAEAGCNMPDLYIKLAFGELNKILPMYNAIKREYYWIRMVDMGNKLVKGSEFPKVKILIFDFDNTLVKLNINWVSVKLNIEHYLESRGYKIKLTRLGPQLNEILRIISQKKGKRQVNKIKKDIDAIFQNEESKSVKSVIINEKIAKLLKNLNGKNIKTAILSDNGEKTIKSVVAKNFRNRFNYIVGRESKTYFKPHPAGLKLIIKKAHCSKEEVLLIGDSSYDKELAEKNDVKYFILSSKTDYSTLWNEVEKYIY